jgi:hypothetical protein
VLSTETAPDLNLPKPHEHADSRAWRLPANLDPEWIAFEVYNDEDDSESDRDDLDTPTTDTPPSRAGRSRYTSPEPAIANALSKLTLRSETATLSPHRIFHDSPNLPAFNTVLQLSPNKRSQPAIKTSLSLLEMLTKLAALQQFRQESHLAIEDELLNFFLEDSGTAGAGADKTKRRRMRHDAARRVGFDPYDESPIKRRNETYIQQRAGGGGASPLLAEGRLGPREAERSFLASSPLSRME